MMGVMETQWRHHRPTEADEKRQAMGIGLNDIEASGPMAVLQCGRNAGILSVSRPKPRTLRPTGETSAMQRHVAPAGRDPS
jgi:hypothetical protein